MMKREIFNETRKNWIFVTTCVNIKISDDGEKIVNKPLVFSNLLRTILTEFTFYFVLLTVCDET